MLNIYGKIQSKLECGNIRKVNALNVTNKKTNVTSKTNIYDELYIGWRINVIDYFTLNSAIGTDVCLYIYSI